MYDNGYGVGDYPSQPQNSNQDQISKQICKVHGKDKVIDFRDGLHYANYVDFANIHGVGGKKHAPNSTIQVVLCDYSKGKGENSVNVRFRLEVEDIEILHEAARKAYFGELSGSLKRICAQVIERMRAWFCIASYPDGSRPVAESEIVQLGQMLRNALEEQSFSYNSEKNNPYAEDNGMVPVQRISITYNALATDGQESRYPWMISIENFQAPIKKMENGASYHLSKQGTKRVSANIMMSKVDFLRSMIAVSRYIRNWEALYRDTMRKALAEHEEQAKQRRAGMNQGGYTPQTVQQAPSMPAYDPMLQYQYGNYGGYNNAVQ